MKVPNTTKLGTRKRMQKQYQKKWHPFRREREERTVARIEWPQAEASSIRHIGQQEQPKQRKTAGSSRRHKRTLTCPHLQEKCKSRRLPSMQTWHHSRGCCIATHTTRTTHKGAWRMKLKGNTKKQQERHAQGKRGKWEAGTPTWSDPTLASCECCRLLRGR